MVSDANAMRALGIELAAHVNTLQDPNDYSIARLQAIAADLIGSSFDLLIPTRDLLARPSFRNLVHLAGSGNGVAYKNGVLQELETIYGVKTLASLNELMNGFLGLQLNNAWDDGSSRELDSKRSSPIHSNRARQGRNMSGLKSLEVIQPVLSRQLTGIIISSVIFSFFGGPLVVIVGLFAFIDAWKSGVYKRKGISSVINISPAGWGMAMQGLLIFAYPLYLINRNRLKTKEAGNVFYILTAVLGGVCLALIVLWTLNKLFTSGQ